MRMLTLKAKVGTLLSRFGYVVYRMEEENIIRPTSNYTPWRSDQAFRRAHEQVLSGTMADTFRLYELWQLIEQSAKLEGDILEVGVWRGGSSALMALRARELGIDATLFACDTFSGVVKTGALDPVYKGGEHADTSRARVEALFSSLGLDRIRILEGIFPEQSAHAISDRRFRFCHIDVDAYQSAKDITEWVWPRLVPGGMIVHDDYGFLSTAGVTQHVDEQRPMADRLVIHNLNGHAVVIKLH